VVGSTFRGGSASKKGFFTVTCLDFGSVKLFPRPVFRISRVWLFKAEHHESRDAMKANMFWVSSRSTARVWIWYRMKTKT